MRPSCPDGPAIAVKGLDFWYSPAEPLFKGFCWQVGRGESWSIIGPSGSGKTTLLYLLAGLRKPVAGEIIAAGESVRGPMRNVVLMLQDFGLLPWLTARGNVELGMRIKGISAAERRRSAMHWLERLGIAAAAEALPSRLSGGQRQRVALARVLALQPDVLLLDEPFSSLDELTREQLQVLLWELKADIQATVVMITHSVEEAVLLGQRVLVLAPRQPVEVVNHLSNHTGRSMPSRQDPAFQGLCTQLRRELGSCG